MPRKPSANDDASPKGRKRAPEGCDPKTGGDLDFLTNELGYEEEEDDQDDWFAPHRKYTPPIAPE